MKGLTIGTFDLVHYGHVDFLKVCSQLCDELCVGVNTDAFVETFKPSPIMSYKERCHGVRSLGYKVCANESSGRKLIEFITPDVLLVGSDWARKDYPKQIDVTQDWLDTHHIVLAYVPYVQYYPISSSEIKRRILNA